LAKKTLIRSSTDHFIANGGGRGVRKFWPGCFLFIISKIPVCFSATVGHSALVFLLIVNFNLWPMTYNIDSVKMKQQVKAQLVEKYTVWTDRHTSDRLLDLDHTSVRVDRLKENAISVT